MLPTNSGGPRRASGAVCYVVADASSLTALYNAIDEDLTQSRIVHLLDCGKTPLRITDPRIQIHRLERIAIPATSDINQIHNFLGADRSDRVRRALAVLHREHHFEAIHFGVQRGLGFRSIQAKRAGLTFDDVELAVHFDSFSQYERERNLSFAADLDEVNVDYMEKYSFGNADRQVVARQDWIPYLQKMSWRVETKNVACLPSDTYTSMPLVTVGIAHHNLGRFLPAALESLAKQTYPSIEVIVIDDGSTHGESIDAIAKLESVFPRFRFLRQLNAGIGATRNRCLAEARGEFFIPMDADNIARPDMVERFVRGMRRNLSLSAMTCYFLAFEDCDTLEPDRFLYAFRPTGGPHVLSCIRNVYGDANGVFRTADFREIGGYETDRGTSCEDWEAYVKLAHAGKKIDVIPEYLFYYRHREAGFSRSTNWFANHQRVLRQFKSIEHLSASDAATLWTALLGFQQRVEQLKDRQQCYRYRVADAIHSRLSFVPATVRWLKKRFVRPRS